MSSPDHQLFLRINDLARTTPWFHGTAAAFATYGVVLFAALLAMSLWHSRHAPDHTLAAAGWAGLGVLVAVAVNQPIAALVAEPRPYAGHPDVLVLVSRSTDWSFPSDHSVMAGACAMGLLITARHLRSTQPLVVVAVLAALAMAADRVYVGAHYPLDVVGGLVLGGVVSWLGWLLLRGFLTRTAVSLRRAPLVRVAFTPPMAVPPRDVC